jgi:hypothetical protein
VAFSQDSLRRIAVATRYVEKSPRRAHNPPAPPPTIVLPSYLGITSSITARSGKTPGFGDVQPYLFNGTTLVTYGPTVKVFNWTGTAITTSSWVEYNWMYGAFWLNGHDCSGVTP